MQKPRPDIAIFLPDLAGGGAERMMLHLFEGLQKRGLEVDLVLTKRHGPLLKQIQNNPHVISLEARNTWLGLPAYVRYLKARRPRAVLATLDVAMMVAIIGKIVSGVPHRLVLRFANHVSSNLHAPLRKTLYFWGFRYLTNHYDHSIGISRHLSHEIITKLKVPSARVSTVFNPVIRGDFARRAASPLPVALKALQPYVLAVGRLTPQKDYPTLLRAFAKAPADHTLVILGEGLERDNLVRLATDLNIAHRVKFVGFLDNPLPVMKGGSAFVFSSRHEGLGNVLVEALACGVPVISTDCPHGPREILANGKFGKLVPVGDHEAMACSINEILAKPYKPPRDLNKHLNQFRQMQVTEQYLKVLLNG